MKNLFYRIAKSIVERHESKSKTQYSSAGGINYISYEANRKWIREKFINKFIQEQIEEFKKNSFPKFKVGQSVLTNWFHPGNSWWGSVSGYQKHTPHKGPILVRIKKVSADASFLEELLEGFHQNEKFRDLILREDNYLNFCEIAETQLILNRNKFLTNTNSIPTPYIIWVYKIQIDDGELNYWNYYWPEEFFLPLNTPAAILSQKTWRKDQKANKAREKANKEKEKV